MAQALCENDHPLVTGESRCPECGERIKMQWMSPRAVRDGSSRRPDPAVEQNTEKRFAVSLSFHVLTGLCLLWANWDHGLTSWGWLVAAIWLFGIALISWDWRRQVRKAQTAQPTH